MWHGGLNYEYSAGVRRGALACLNIALAVCARERPTR
jgi:hypothetical protein